MFCPKCSQQQVSEEASYCSRCGFALAGVSELIAHDGLLPARTDDEAQWWLSRRQKKHLWGGAILLLLGVVLTLFMSAFDDIGAPGETFAMIAAIIFFLVGLLGLGKIVYAFFAGEEKGSAGRMVSAVPGKAQPGRMASRPRADALPPAQSIPVAAFNASRVDTAEMAHRPSVTEGTTKLLDD